MNVLVTLNPGLGSGLGPNFTVYSNIGSYVYSVTLAQLLAGIELTFEDTAAIVIIESLGICLTILPLTIEPTTSTTTTTSTTLPCEISPTIDTIEYYTTTTTTTTV